MFRIARVILKVKPSGEIKATVDGKPIAGVARISTDCSNKQSKVTIEILGKFVRFIHEEPPEGL